jgi:8-oxo-dGTP pyrophosphatase MutT (NUDIX family)
MDQKYKFFVKRNAVIFSQNAETQENNPQLTKYWIDRLLLQEVEEDIVVEISDLRSFINQLRESILFIKAGGGFVVNERNELLMILRRGFWDLPKGKLDEGETIEECAIREVQEECGVSMLTISSAGYSTFHLFKDRGKTVIKESIWFKMRCTDHSKLTPQIKEDIVEARWVKLPVAQDLRQEAYPSIKQVIDHFS